MGISSKLRLISFFLLCFLVELSFETKSYNIAMRRRRAAKALTDKILKETEKSKRFKQVYFVVKPHNIESFLDQLTDWSYLSPQERHRNIQKIVKKYAYIETIDNIVITALGKVRQLFDELNRKTGLDDKIEDLMDDTDSGSLKPLQK